jgi:hypothetical protein
MHNVEKGKDLSQKKAYEPPKAIRLGEMRNGAGYCNTGSGDNDECNTAGNSAVLQCTSSGNSAIWECSSSGIGV